MQAVVRATASFSRRRVVVVHDWDYCFGGSGEEGVEIALSSLGARERDAPSSTTAALSLAPASQGYQGKNNDPLARVGPAALGRGCPPIRLAFRAATRPPHPTTAPPLLLSLPVVDAMHATDATTYY